MKCPKCNTGEISRVQRFGFLETQLLSRLGYFPWECSICRKRVRIKTRGWSGRPRNSGEQPI